VIAGLGHARRVVAVALAIASCTAHAAGSYPSKAASAPDGGSDDDVTFGGPESMHTLARTDCRAAGVSALWRGVTVHPERLQSFGLRAVNIRFADGEEVTFRSIAGEVHAWPEVVFSPDCRRVALLGTRHGPYVIVATRLLRRYLKGGHVAARYLRDDVPCEPELVYQDLKWRSNDEVEYRSGAGELILRRRRVDEAADRDERARCLDPKSPLYEGPPR